MLPLLLAARALAAEPPPEREIILMLDVSCSMPAKGKLGDYSKVLAGARKKAESLLAPFTDDPSVEVSLYFFGDIKAEGASWRPDVRPIVEHAGVPTALSKFDAFFLPQFDASRKNNYSDAYTYVAASIYELVAPREGLSDPCAPITPKKDAPVLSILVLTDAGEDGGGESSPSCAMDPGRCKWEGENKKRKQWLASKDMDNSLSYTHWNIGDDNVSMVGPGEAVYRAQWVTKAKDSFNLRDPAVSLNQTLTGFEPHIRLVAEGMRPSGDWTTRHPELLCERRSGAPVAASPARQHPVDIQAEWRLRDGGARLNLSDGLLLSTPARALVGAGYDLHTLRLELPGTLQLPIPSDAKSALALVPDDALRLERNSLCEALLDAYPNSTFRLPPDTGAAASNCTAPPPPPAGGYRLKPVATVGLADTEVVKKWRFMLSADGIRADAPAKPLVTDRWWRATGGETRKLLLQPSGDMPASWSANLKVQLERGGKPVSETFTDVASMGGASNATVPPDGVVAVQLPGGEQRWWTLGGDFPNGADGGEASLHVCVDAQVADPGAHRVNILCEECSSLEETSDGHACVDIPVTIVARPLWSVWRIAGATVASLLSLWLAVRWIWRPRLPERMIVGTTSLRLRGASEKWGLLTAELEGAYRTTPSGTPFFLDISGYKVGAVDKVHLHKTGTTCLGVRARAGGGMLLWPARLPEGTTLIVKTEGQGPAVSLTVPGAIPIKPMEGSCIGVSARADLVMVLTVRDDGADIEVLRIFGSPRRA